MASWKCSCGLTNRATAAFCPGCGTHWTKVQIPAQSRRQPKWQGQGAGSSWGEEWQTEWQPSSPRTRQRPRSPRKRGDDAKGKGKGKHKTQAEPPWTRDKDTAAAPSVSQLPKPPRPKPVAAPKPSQPTETATEDRKILDSLMERLSQQEELPDSVRQLMAQATRSSARTEAKALHKLVAQRQEATSALTKIRTERLAFETGWAMYTQALLDLLTKQFAEREATLASLDEL
ncbi:hypothetical protein AK812_SmicGene7365 [Symbiodinium microadriaticum]|uniref:Uncharacterized protein n=1 Tax=Symbiodinium microadriaticum TaxID=2951 RepID=A0A1Q9ENS7_SYMMI|nr:hypothetical protein AK812_SmicGene7365 [Symbiodinium microadriaticum]